MADIEIEIDGRKLTAEPNETVIQVADKAGIYIPRFCYHKHLSIAANCRMCLVEVEKSPKALPACATPVMPGMKVFTKSAKTIEAQRAVMEFLLINHPLDCPICDQGGECELQDLSMGYGASTSHYDECKRATPDQDIGPLIATDMTRCIYCTRCVRFGDEVAGMRELGGVNRGGHTEISTYVQHAITSEVSGNIIDLCPVGALTSKPYRFTARAWELKQSPSIAPHDCIGTNVNVHTRNGKVMRVVSRENMAINETWMSDRDRFSYAGLYHADRLAQPRVKINGEWQTVEWQQALEVVSAKLHESITKHGADQLGALASPNSTIEEFYLLQKIMRGLGTEHIDHRLRDVDTQDESAMGAFPGFSMPIADIDDCDAIVIIGSNIQKEQPLASLRVRKAALKGAAVIVLNPMDYAFNFKVTTKHIVAPHLMVKTLADHSQAMADQLQGKKKMVVILGALASHHPQASSLRYLAQKLANTCGAQLGLMTDGANSAGAWLAGAIPHRQAGGVAVHRAGLNASMMLEQSLKAYVLLNVEPDLDCVNASRAIHALQHADFVVALSTYSNPVLEAHADVILPIANFTETSGTFVNVTGEWQSFNGVANAYESSRPAWKVLRVLGNFLHLQGFEYESSEEVKHEIHAIVEKMPAMSMQLTQPKTFSTTVHDQVLTRIGEIPIYALDSLVRRSQPLQKTQALMEGDVSVLRIHPETAKKLHLQDGKEVLVQQNVSEAKLPVIIDERVAEGAIWVAGGISATMGLGDLFGIIEIKELTSALC